MQRRVVVAMAFVVVLVGAAHGGRAAEATPLTVDCAVGVGVRIDSAGDYVLQPVAPNCGSSTAIYITASDVTLDLADQTLDGNDTADTEGIVVQGGGDVAINDTKVSRNRTHSNAADGIVINDEVDPATTTIAKNKSNDNAQQGIDLTGTAVPKGVETNKARGNGIEPQCDGGLCG